MNDTEKQKIREDISKILVKWSMPTRQVAIDEILEILDKTIKSKLEAVEEIMQKERETWARESIGAKAVESVQNAIKGGIINKHK
jgi:hypothetical protein